jgi:hypothetical protein
MHIQDALDHYLTAVAAAAACVDTVHTRIAAVRMPKIFLTIEGKRKGKHTDVLLVAREVTDPGHRGTQSAHAALAHKAARLAWEQDKQRTAQGIRDAGVDLVRAVVDGPHQPDLAVLHTSVAPGMVVAQLCLDHGTPFEPAHAIDLVRQRAAFTALIHATQDPLGHPGRPHWLVTAFLRPWKGRSDEEVDCVQRVVKAGTVEQAILATALTGVNAMLDSNRMDDIQIWKSLEADDAAAFHAYLARNRTTSDT